MSDVDKLVTVIQELASATERLRQVVSDILILLRERL